MFLWLAAISCLALFAVLILAQAIPTIRVIRAMRGRSRNLLPDESCPKAAIIMSLRGGDPFLFQTLEALFRQDYPNYQVNIVVDHPDDPAWQALNDAMQRFRPSHVQVQTLSERHETCSLKISSVLQVLSRLDDSFEVVAVIDADIVPHPSWLRDLVTPLADSRVAVSTGQRWFRPRASSLGSSVRYLWGVRDMVHSALDIAWGGSLCLKRRFLNESGILQIWQNSLSEDAPLNRLVPSAGYRIAFVPAVTAVSDETCRLSWFWRFLSRQFLVGWLYVPGALWRMPLFNLQVLFVFSVSIALAGWSAAAGNWETLCVIAGGWIVYAVAMLLQILVIERNVTQVAQLQGKAYSKLSVPMLVILMAISPVYRLVVAAASVAVVFLKEVEWRGIRYHIEPDKKIRVGEYLPYRPDPSMSGGQSSV